MTRRPSLAASFGRSITFAFQSMRRSAAVCIGFAVACATIASTPVHAQCDVMPGSGSGLVTPYNAASDNFGVAVAVNGSVAISGANYDDDNGSASGSASIFRMIGSNWQHEKLLLASDGTLADNFGSAVAIAGDWALVGAPNDEDYAVSNGSNIGSVYVFRRISGQWQQVQKLYADNPASNDQFGTSVAMDGTVAIVGTPRDNGHTFQGAAYIFRLNGSTWVKERKLNAGSTTSAFGTAVGVSGNFAVVGAPSETYSTYQFTGASYIFEYTGSNWVQRQRLVASDPVSGAHFGASVAIDGDMAVIGTPDDDDNGAASGSTYVFRRSGSTWIQSQKLHASDPYGGDQFGRSVSVTPTLLIVGAKRSWTWGAAYAWRRSGTTWVFENKLPIPVATNGDAFGWAVSASGSDVLVGAPTSDVTTYNGGAVWYLSGACSANTAPTLTVSSPSNNSQYTQGQSVTFSASATDAEDGNITSSIIWSSSLQGTIGPGGGSFSLSNLVVGTHVITASVADSDGLTDSVNRTITINASANTAPSLTINSPANNSSFGYGQSIVFSGTASDTQDGSLSHLVVWTSNIQSPSQLGVGASISVNNLVVGTHTITARVTDSGGLSTTKTRTVSITSSNTPPVVNITSPANNASYNYGATIWFNGNATDQQDGTLTSSLMWASSLQGVIGTGGSFTRNDLIAGTHVISAWVTDSGGLTSSVNRLITVTGAPTNSAPVVSIFSPSNNYRVTVGTPITFSGSANDAESGNLSSLMVWTSNLQGQIGVGASFVYAGLGVGTHVITASATDSGGLTGTATRTVIIDPQTIPSYIDSVPNSGSLAYGSSAGSYTLAQTNDGSYQAITEKSTNGNPSKRVSSLEYKWTIAVANTGTQRSFHLKAYRSGTEAADNFLFAYSTNGNSWTNMVTVTQTSNNGTYQVFNLPSNLNGTVHIRVIDTDRTQGNSALDTIYVDHMFIRSQ